MNNLDARYQALLEDILHFGVEKPDRTGTGTISVFGRQIRHKMSEGFPLLTTKKMAWKSIVTELLWFLRGDTNIKFLLDYDCHIWDGDAYKNYEKKYFDYKDGFVGIDVDDSRNNEIRKYTKEEFINKIKTDDEFCKKWGDLGPIYGAQWRNWLNVPNEINKGGIDQITNLISELKINPDSRRLMVSAWNLSELNQMVLPPCHYGFQMYTRKLTLEERHSMVSRISDKVTSTDLERKEWIIVDDIPYKIPTRAISLMWNQRSVDTFLGLPFNIASYALLLEIIAREVEMVPDELIGNLGDVHLYSNHIEQAKEQISRTPYELPKIQITERNWYIHESVKEKLGEKSFSEKILSYRPDCFELIDYQSHPKIKAPLSN
jgi:thymidylate synthase